MTCETIKHFLVCCITIFLVMSGISIYGLIEYEAMKKELQTIKLDLECMEYCVRGFQEMGVCSKRFFGDDVGSNVCASILNFSKDNIAEVVDDKLLHRSNINSDYIDEVAHLLVRNDSSKYSALKRKFDEELLSLERPTALLVPDKQRSRRQHYNLIWKCGGEGFGGFYTRVNCSTDGVAITEEGFYSIHLHTNFQKRPNSGKHHVIKQSLMKRGVGGEAETMLEDKITPHSQRYLTLDSTAVIRLIKGDHLYAEVNTYPSYPPSMRKQDTSFSLFLVSKH